MTSTDVNFIKYLLLRYVHTNLLSDDDFSQYRTVLDKLDDLMRLEDDLK